MNTGNVRLVKVDTKNFHALIDLTPFESQSGFVARNIYSLAEAYANISEGRYAQPFGIYDGETPVGFLMIGFDIADEEDDREKYPFLANNYLIWRFMIDKDHQKKGYGKAAMKLALDFIRTWPCGKAEYCWLSYEPENETARKLYQSFGFAEAEKIPEGWDEIPAVLKLQTGGAINSLIVRWHSDEKALLRAVIDRIDLYPEKCAWGCLIRNIVFSFPVPVPSVGIKELPLGSQRSVRPSVCRYIPEEKERKDPEIPVLPDPERETDRKTRTI